MNPQFAPTQNVELAFTPLAPGLERMRRRRHRRWVRSLHDHSTPLWHCRPMDHLRRTRDAYGGSANRYLELVGSMLSDEIETVADLELLTRFIRTASTTNGRALDAGCGTGRVARSLADHGLEAVGVDIAVEMVELARREHPDVCFTVGELHRLPFGRRRFSSAVFWYSIITTPPDEISRVWDELRRVLLDRGIALVAFQAGVGESVERPNAYGSGVDLTLYRHATHFVADALESSGFDVEGVVERAAERAHEDSGQTFITARLRTKQ